MVLFKSRCDACHMSPTTARPRGEEGMGHEELESTCRIRQLEKRRRMEEEKGGFYCDPYYDRLSVNENTD